MVDFAAVGGHRSAVAGPKGNLDSKAVAKFKRYTLSSYLSNKEIIQ